MMERRALLALIVGAILIGLAPIFVRLSDVGASAAAFWRLSLSLPFLMPFWLGAPRPSWVSAPRSAVPWTLVLGGLFLAADLAVWHHSIAWTSVANATLLANLAPVWVALVAWLLFGERIVRGFWLGLSLTLLGAAVLMSGSVRISLHSLFGDGVALGSSVLYAGYLLAVSRARAHYSTVQVMGWTAAVASLVLLPVAVLESGAFWPQSVQGWWIVLGLALVSQIGGQGLIAFGFAHLPASFSAVTLLIQPVAAALFAWLLLSERFGVQQMLGGLLALGGILWCRAAMTRAARATSSAPIQRR